MQELARQELTLEEMDAVAGAGNILSELGKFLKDVFAGALGTKLGQESTSLSPFEPGDARFRPGDVDEVYANAAGGTGYADYDTSTLWIDQNNDGRIDYSFRFYDDVGIYTADTNGDGTSDVVKPL